MGGSYHFVILKHVRAVVLTFKTPVCHSSSAVVGFALRLTDQGEFFLLQFCLRERRQKFKLATFDGDGCV